MVSSVFNRARGSRGRDASGTGVRPRFRRFASRAHAFKPKRQGKRRSQYSPFFFLALVITLVSTIGFVAILSTALMTG